MSETPTTLEDLFDDRGDLPRDFDPYRCGREDDPRYGLLFDGEGFLKDEVDRALVKLVKANGWGPWCDAVAMYHADHHAMSTKGSYPTIYYWRY